MKFSIKKSAMFQLFLLLLVYINIFMDGRENRIILVLLFSLSICNDFYRKEYLKKKDERSWNIRSAVSIMFSILTAGILKYTVGSYMYIYIILVELLFYDKKQIPVYLLGFYGICYLFPAVGYFENGTSTEAWSKLGFDMLFFLAGVFICVMILEQMKHKENLEVLNQQLNEKNELLKQQQQLNEELTRSRERERIAQELHDSIGHTLVAVKMYAKVLEKYIAIDPVKEKEILDTLNEVIQDSILQLRKTVYRLKETNQYTYLKESLEQLIQSVSHTESQKIHLEFDDEIENSALELKEDIYQSIRECITNSMKYSAAENIWITITMTDGGLEFSVRDDGVGAGVIRKSYGILGIEERMKKWNGVCMIKSTANNGFTLQVQINFRQEAGVDD